VNTRHANQSQDRSRSTHRSDTPRSELIHLLDAEEVTDGDLLLEVWELAGDDEPTAFPHDTTAAADIARLTSRLVSDPDELNRDRRTDRRPLPRHRSTLFRMASRPGVAVVMAVVALLAVSAFFYLQPAEWSAPPGEQKTVELPDDTRIQLNSGSSARFSRLPAWLSGGRSIRLTGEAFFDVAPQDRPFIITTHDARITVMGTRFNVRSWSTESDPTTTVTLVSGSVGLTPTGQGAETVVMTPGETRRTRMQVTPTDLRTEIIGIAIEDMTAWRNGDFVFKNASLETILHEIERRFAVTIDLSAPEFSERILNVALRRPTDARSVIHDVAAGIGLRYRPTLKGYELYAPDRG